MSFIDSILDAFGLQRKNARLSEPLPDPIKAQAKKQTEVANAVTVEMSEAVTELFTALYQRRIADVKDFAVRVREGKLTEEEYQIQIQRLFGGTGIPGAPETLQGLQGIADIQAKRARGQNEQAKL